MADRRSAVWRCLFAANVPIGFAALAVGYFTLPVTPRVKHALDLIAAALNIAAIGLTIVGIDWMARGGNYGLGGAGIGGGHRSRMAALFPFATTSAAARPHRSAAQ